VGKNPLGRPRHGWENAIEMDFTEVKIKTSGRFCESGNELHDFIREFCYMQSNCWLFKINSAP
jgi:hypothetical protein